MSQDGKDKLILLVVGFVLTGVIGAVIGWYLQNDTWDRRWVSQYRGELAANQETTFNYISNLLGMRLYAMRRLAWALEGHHPIHDVETSAQDYREMLIEWNDNLNRNRSLLEVYVGDQMRVRFDQIYNQMRIASIRLHDLYSEYLQRETEQLDISGASTIIDAVNRSIFRFNVGLVDMIQENRRSLIRNWRLLPLDS